MIATAVLAPFAALDPPTGKPSTQALGATVDRWRVERGRRAQPRPRMDPLSGARSGGALREG